MLFEGWFVRVSFVHVPHPLITFLFDQQRKEVKCPAFKVLGRQQPPSFMSVRFAPSKWNQPPFFLAFKKKSLCRSWFETGETIHTSISSRWFLLSLIKSNLFFFDSSYIRKYLASLLTLWISKEYLFQLALWIKQSTLNIHQNVLSTNHVELYKQMSVTSFMLFHLLNCVLAISSKQEKKKKYNSLMPGKKKYKKKKSVGILLVFQFFFSASEPQHKWKRQIKKEKKNLFFYQFYLSWPI